MSPSLADFKALSFDCYGTLIDWETGIFDKLQPLLDRIPHDHPLHSRDAVVARCDTYQKSLEQEKPSTPYTQVLAHAYTRLAQDMGLTISQDEALAFGQAAGEWPAFADTVEGLKKLKKYYRLIILSNVDHRNVQKTINGPLSGVEFDAIITAEDVGHYKPRHHNFQYLFNYVHDRFGLNRTMDLLHTAKSLPVDHVPAKELGLPSAWIARGDSDLSAMGGDIRELKDQVAYTWRFSSIGEMAEAVEKAFSGIDHGGQ